VPSRLATPDEETLPHEHGRSRRRYDPSWDDWKHGRRWPGIVLTMVVVLAFIGVVAWHFRPHPAHKASSAPGSFTSTNIRSAFVPGASKVGVAIKSYHGTRNALNLRFATDGKLLVLHAACRCAYNFVVTIQNVERTPVAFPITATGPFNSSINLTLPAGTYSAQVVAPAPASWSLQFIQPGPAAPTLKTPFIFNSNTPSVIGPFSSANKFLFFRFFSEANGVARVYVLDPAGNRVDEAFAGRTTIFLGKTLPDPSNPFYVEVDASGLWKLRVQHAGGH
jgi:hypothetical protein